ncbi:MAG: hypothetical protein LUO79_07880 [Methanomassiliicoccales archaeon]|nr:hypothetical protein [Methanomassiliicoccales archaeon]
MRPMVEPFDWSLNPEAENHLHQLVDWFLDKSDALYDMSKRIEDATGTRLYDWVDHVRVPVGIADRKAVQAHGLRTVGRSKVYRADGTALFPLVIGDGTPELGLKVWNIDAFRREWSLDDAAEGEPNSAFRKATVLDEEELRVLAIERRGFAGFDSPEVHDAGAYEDALRRFEEREREFHSQEKAFSDLEETISSAAARLGVPRLADAFFRTEISYWLSRNSAARQQLEVQDELGLGLANLDHVTFRSSRPAFKRLIRVMRLLGLEQRERFYAGDKAGWGAQVLENEESGHVVFADVDLRPKEKNVDFASNGLEDGGKMGTVGLWVALHGESAFQAGLHHVALRFDLDRGRAQFEGRGIRVMDPFSDLPFLKQAFTEGENWRAEHGRIERAEREGSLTTEAAERLQREGTIGSHLELIERRQGFKGFNQDSVSAIIKATDPRQVKVRGA